MADDKNYNIYRFPKMARFFDHKSIYIIFMVFALVVSIGYGGWTTLNTIKDIGEPLEKSNEYQNISVSDSMGVKWAKNFVKTAPPYLGIKSEDWRASTNISPAQPVEFKECNSFNLLSPTVLASTTGTGASLQVTTQLYNTAYALKGYNDYKKTFGKCWDVNTKKYGSGNRETEVANYGKGFFFTYGDAVIFVIADQVDDSLINYYVENAAKTLLQYDCNILDGSESDVKRSIYIDEKQYTGLWKNEVINTNMKLNNVPNPVYPVINDVTLASEPEAPLPKNFPEAPKTIPAKPNLPQNPEETRKEFSKEISFQVSDAVGPTCGWRWLGFKAPITDDAKLKSTQKSLEDSTLQLLNSNAQEYITNKIEYSKVIITLMDSIETWKKYEKAVDAVNSKRNWLNSERDKLKPLWDQYIKDHEAWENFDSLKNKALTEYNAKVDACNAQNKAVSDWDAQYGQSYNNGGGTPTPTPTYTSGGGNSTPTVTSDATDGVSTPTPTDGESTNSTPEVEPTDENVNPTGAASTVTTPPRPTACTETPVLPEIASQVKGDEPQPPTAPEGVTIPNSWPKVASQDETSTATSSATTRN